MPRLGALSKLFSTLALVALSSCGDDPCPDGACPRGDDVGPPLEDASPLAAEPPDAGLRADGGPPPEAGVLWNTVTCQPCSSCAPEVCLTVEGTGESFCADRCDAEPSACVFGFSCLDVDPAPEQARRHCVPPGVSCARPGLAYGAPCFGDVSSCLPGQDRCEGDGIALGFCTRTCTREDCPRGFRCGLGDPVEGGGDRRVCQPLEIAGAELCGRTHDASELPCAVDEDCAPLPGSTCVRSDPELTGVCARPCEEWATCTDGRACLTTHRGPRCLSEACACHGRDLPAGTRDLWVEALEAAGLTPCGASFRLADSAATAPDIAHDPYRLSEPGRVRREPLRAAAWGRALTARLDGEARAEGPIAARAARVIEALALRLDRPAVHQAPGPLDVAAPLVSAVASLITETGGAPDLDALAADAADVPLDLQLALATVVEALERAAVARRRAIAAFADSAEAVYDYGPALLVPRADGLALAPASEATRRVLTELFGSGDLAGAAADVLDAVAVAELERFRRVSTTTTATRAAFAFAQDTPIGRIALDDGEPGIYDARDPGFEGAWALLVDLGGDDTYHVPAGGNVGVENAVSVLIDLGGDDDHGYRAMPDPNDGARLPSDGAGRYAPTRDPTRETGPISFSETPRQGGARLGTAILLDLGGGRDRYRSLRMSQGAGVFGVGALIDDGGDDLYEAEAFAQGAGAFGIGLLLDGGGADTRRAYTQAQGFGFALGAGLLHDAGGDDLYALDVGDPALGGDPLYFSAQRPGRANSSLGQGFGFGRRADGLDGAFMSGGLGLLVDAEGQDRYRASIFAQGGGFWFGTGILADLAGDDEYDGLWYVTGVGAHYALGLLLDGGGRDRYGQEVPPINVTLGAGHDFSAALLIDEAGDDVYTGNRITLGAGNANGWGLFVDNAGDDRYATTSPFSLGAGGLLGPELDFPGSPRRALPVVGLFLDAGGRDQYARAGMSVPGLMDDATWSQTVSTSSVVNRIEHGGGIDGMGETSLHAR